MGSGRCRGARLEGSHRAPTRRSMETRRPLRAAVLFPTISPSRPWLLTIESPDSTRGGPRRGNDARLPIGPIGDDDDRERSCALGCSHSRPVVLEVMQRWEFAQTPTSKSAGALCRPGRQQKEGLGMERGVRTRPPAHLGRHGPGEPGRSRPVSVSKSSGETRPGSRSDRRPVS